MMFKETYTDKRSDLDRTGVYSITHTDYDGYFYIGSAAKFNKINYRDVGFLLRWRNHFSDLRRGVHHNKFLQSIVNKYGLSGIRFNIIEYCEPYNCSKRETFYIQYYKSRYRVFNFSDFSQSLLGRNQSKETIDKIRKNNKNCRKVYQYDMDGHFISEWISMSEAARQTGLNVGLISKACQRSGVCGEFQWKYKKEKTSKHIGKYKREQGIKKAVYQYSVDGGIINSFSSPKDASINTGIKISSILRSCNGNYVTGGGYVWSFCKNEIIVKPKSKKKKTS